MQARVIWQQQQQQKKVSLHSLKASTRSWCLMKSQSFLVPGRLTSLFEGIMNNILDLVHVQ